METYNILIQIVQLFLCKTRVVDNRVFMIDLKIGIVGVNHKENKSI